MLPILEVQGKFEGYDPQNYQIMTLEDHLFAFDYNAWANERIFNSLASLTPDQLTRDLGGSFPTLLRTMEHLLSAEWVWLRRWQGEIKPDKPAWLPVASLEALIDVWQTLQAQRTAFLTSLSDEDMEREIRYTFSSGYSSSSTLSKLLRHLINHSTYHRGQIASMLRRLGVDPPATDMVLFEG